MKTAKTNLRTHIRILSKRNKLSEKDIEVYCKGNNTSNEMKNRILKYFSKHQMLS